MTFDIIVSFQFALLCASTFSVDNEICKNVQRLFKQYIASVFFYIKKRNKMDSQNNVLYITTNFKCCKQDSIERGHELH